MFTNKIPNFKKNIRKPIITDYNVQGERVTATYRILDAEGVYQETKDGEWDLATGAPKKKFND